MIRAGIIAIFAVILLSRPASGRAVPTDGALVGSDVSEPTGATIESLRLTLEQHASLVNALRQHDYKKAEKLLVQETERDPQSATAANRFVFVGHVFFLDAQYLDAAIAWKKADALRPLDERDRFTLAMAYIKLMQAKWAREELERLRKAYPGNALYLYWLGRLDYDAQAYHEAITRFQEVVRLDPKMMRAYENLGLCYDYLGRYSEAIENYRRAVELNRVQASPSPWPHLNFGLTLMALNRFDDAETQFREAIRHDGTFAQAHYQLGQVLQKKNELESAVQEFQDAIRLDPSYAEPHYALGKLDQRLGRHDDAQEEVSKFRELKRGEQGDLQQPQPAK